MHIIIGLGNPTDKYQATRHNIGWDAITRLSDDYNIPLDFRKHKAICGKGYIEGEKVVLAQPLTYMNLSGESVRELVDFYKVTPEDIIVIYDDAAKILNDKNASVTQRSLAGGVLSQRDPAKQTGAAMEDKASKVLQSEKYSDTTKSLAASLLSQSNKAR